VVGGEAARWIGLGDLSKVGKSSSLLEWLGVNDEGVLGVDSDGGFGDGVLYVVKFTGSFDSFPFIAGLENLPFASLCLVVGASVLVRRFESHSQSPDAIAWSDALSGAARESAAKQRKAMECPYLLPKPALCA
jgi:hypothetical protein